MTTNQRAFLDMLAWAEGTDNGRQLTKDHGYDVLVGGGLFVGYADHPRILVYLPHLGISSDAAGRYQLMARYFNPYKALLKLPDFSPASQDAIALQQIKERGAIPDIDAGHIVLAINKCSNIWASLPGNSYGQHEQAIGTLIAAYKRAGGLVA